MPVLIHLRTHPRFGSILRPLLFVNPILVPVATMGIPQRKLLHPTSKGSAFFTHFHGLTD
jgi:hypothetical protein